jgi:hypothetical protein
LRVSRSTRGGGISTMADKKPNILILWGDDIGQFNISA